MPCKFGKKTPELRNSSAWLCMYKVPLSVVAEVRAVDYRKMEINECLCTKDMCLCYEEGEHSTQQDEYVIILEKLLKERDRLLESIPECPVHGKQCVPHALDWVVEQLKE